LGALKGSISYSKHYVRGDLAEDFRDAFVENIRLRAFRPLGAGGVQIVEPPEEQRGVAEVGQRLDAVVDLAGEDFGVDPVRGDVPDVEGLDVLAHGAEGGTGTCVRVMPGSARLTSSGTNFEEQTLMSRGASFSKSDSPSEERTPRIQRARRRQRSSATGAAYI